MTPRRPQPRPATTHWQRGMTLDERLFAQNLALTHGRTNQSSALNRKMQWRSERRADLDRVHEPDAITADPPPWLRTFRSAYAKAAQHKRSSGSANDLLEAVEPLIADAHRRIDAALRESPAGFCAGSSDDRAVLVSSLEASLRTRLGDAVSRTLVLELAVASRLNVLTGRSTEERFAFFCNSLADPDFARALLEQYPVLVRRISSIARNWEASTLEMLSRLAASRPALRRNFFGGDDPGPLMSVESSGDVHRAGRTVHILRFQDGRLVYKPRPVALERCFFDLVGWLIQNGCEPDLREVGTLDEGDFGWMEFVEAKPCRTRDEVERFFVRQGANVGLIYILGGTDIHSENVIAHGEYPVVVDLETLFQTPLPADFTGATKLARHALQMSVMGTQLLPEPMYFGGSDQWIDLSALGHSAGQLTPFGVPVWSGRGTDRMRLQHKRMPMVGGASLPEFENMRVPANRSVDLVVKGLDRVYEFMRRRTHELLDESGPLACAFGKSARRVFRNTDWYLRLLDASYHPRYLGDAIALEAFLHNRLRASPVDPPWRAAIEDTEVADLVAGDIPYFSTSVGQSGHSAASLNKGPAMLGDGWEECRARMRALSDIDLDRQKWLVRVAMADLGTDQPATRILEKTSSDPAPEQLIVTAARIGDRICDLAIIDGERATWLAPAIASETRLLNGVADLGLYEGLPGIALFLGFLDAVTGNVRYGRVAAAAMTEALALYQEGDREELSIGAYDGIGGIAYALIHLADLLDRPEWIIEATNILHSAVRRAAGSSDIDIISGQAGLVVAALAVHHRKHDAALIRRLEPVILRLRRLAARSRKRDRGLLPTSTDAGVAHGRAGIGFALSRWAEARGDNGLHEVAAELICFDLDAIDARRSESSTINTTRQRYAPDLGWCRGWVGAALVALRAKPIAMLIEASRHGRFRRIANEVIDRDFDGPLCLCHGDLGQLEFLEAAEQHDILDFNAAASWRRQLLTRLTAGEWSSDIGHALESPGLMLGLAGTGYSLLRAARPHLIPSVLTLDPPRAKIR